MFVDSEFIIIEFTSTESEEMKLDVLPPFFSSSSHVTSLVTWVTSLVTWDSRSFYLVIKSL